MTTQIAQRVLLFDVIVREDDFPDISTIGRYSFDDVPDERAYSANIIDRGPFVDPHSRYFFAYDSLGDLNPKTGKPWSQATRVKYAKLKYERAEAFNRGDWHYVGVTARARLEGTEGHSWGVDSMGIWGVESDSDYAHIESLGREECEELRAAVREMGFSDKEITAAIDAEIECGIDW